MKSDTSAILIPLAERKFPWRPLLQLAAVATILLYLIFSKQLQFHKFSTLQHQWHWIVYGLLLILPGFIFCTLRLRLLLHALDFPCTFKQSFAWTMIGSFFDLAAPFTGGGDVVKAVYVTSAVGKGRRSVAALSVFVDRLVGLFALFLFALLVCAIAWNRIVTAPQLVRCAGVLLTVCGAALGGFIIISSQTLVHSPLRKRLFQRLPSHHRIEQVYVAFTGLRQKPRALAAIIGLSLLNHMGSCASVLCLAQALTFTSTLTFQPVPLDVLHSLVVLPLALFLNTFGPAGGIGVGEVAFEALFAMMLHVREGGELAFIYHMVVLLTRVFGLPFVLFYRKFEHATVDSTEPQAVSAL